MESARETEEKLPQVFGCRCGRGNYNLLYQQQQRGLVGENVYEFAAI